MRNDAATARAATTTSDGATAPEAGAPDRILTVVLAFLLLVPLAGAFLPGPAAWGFNHLSYLPRWWTLLSAALAGLFLWPRARRLIDRMLSGPIVQHWVERPGAWSIFVVVFALLGTLFRQRSFFLGDGYLVGELVHNRVAFRAFDNLDYLLHLKLFQWLELWKPVDSFTLYRIGAILSGIAFWVVLGALGRYLPWEPWRKALLFGLFLTSGTILIFFGYVESYAVLYVCMTGFILSGYLALQRRLPPWIASTYFGVGIAFHLTALFSAPALLALAWWGRTPAGRRPWLQVFAPALALFAISVALHLWAGYDASWFRKEFIDSKNSKSILVPLVGPYGFFSLYHWKDLANLALVTSPASLAIVASRARELWARRMEPPVLFLLAQVLSVLFCVLAIDRKLGGARDWDLMAAHVSGLIVLAASALPGLRGETGATGATGASRPAGATGASRPTGAANASRTTGAISASRAPGAPRAAATLLAGAPIAASLALGAGFVSTTAWIALNHWEPRAITRFVDVASDFPAFARAYAYEEVGKYYRKREDLPRAQEMYERTVEAYPKNPRFRVLLGGIYTRSGRVDLAEAEFRAALEYNADYERALENLGKLLMMKAQDATDEEIRRGLLDEAVGCFQRLTERFPTQKASYWEALGYALLETDRLPEAEAAYLRAQQLNRNLRVHHSLGAARLGQGKYADAAASFREAMNRGEGNPQTETGLVLALLATARAPLARGLPPETNALGEAETILARLAQRGAQDALIPALAQRAAMIRRGIDPAAGREFLPAAPTPVPRPLDEEAAPPARDE